MIKPFNYIFFWYSNLDIVKRIVSQWLTELKIKTFSNLDTIFAIS